MEKKESRKGTWSPRDFTSLKKEEADFRLKPSAVSRGLSGLYNKAFGIIKFLLGICLLPFVYSTSVAFFGEFSLIKKPYQNYFWQGIISFLIIYLFILELEAVYTRGHKLLEAIFSFFKPLVRIAPYLLPVYTIILFILYAFLLTITKSDRLTGYFIFLFGFTITLHLVFSAKTIRSKKDDFLRGNYIFGFSFVYIINLALLSFCLNLIFKEFSFVNFSNVSFSLAKNIFYTVFKQLFLS